MPTMQSPDSYTAAELTEAVNKLPLIPMRMRPLFRQVGVKTTGVGIDGNQGRLVLVNNQDRREPPEQMAGRGSKRKTVFLEAAHLPLADGVKPEDVQDVRGFGTTEPITKEYVINGKLQDLKNSVSMTTEFHRVGAAQGIIYDADGTTVLHDLYKVFGVTKKTMDLVFPSNTTKFNPILTTILKAKRHAAQKLGGNPVNRFEAIVGEDFYDMLTSQELGRKTFEDGQDGKRDFGDKE